MGSRVSRLKNFPGLVAASAVIAAMNFVALGVEAQESIPEGRLDNSAAEEVTGNTNAMSPKQGITLPVGAGNFSDKPGETKLTRMPANTAFRGLMDSKEYKKMLRELVTSEVPTLYQTMLMVENGAATGFMGSVQSVSQLFGNSMQSAQLELKMREVASPESAKQYVNAVHDGVKKQKGKSENLWPVGLFYASGDKITEPLDDKYKLRDPYNRADDGGASIVQHLPEDSRPDGKEDATTYKLSEVVFKQGTGASSDPREEKIKTFFTDVIGDAEIKKDTSGSDKDNPAIQTDTKYIKPKKKATVEKKSGNSTAGGNEFPMPDEVFGVNVMLEEIRKETWKDMYQLLGLYCEFKKENGNKGLKLFNKKFVSEWIDMAGGDLMKKVSSTNLKVSLNVVDQIFKLWVQTTTDANQPTKIDCKFENAEEEMPKDSEVNDGGDSCEGAEKARKCRRNKWLYRFVDTISLDKLIDQSRDTYETAMRNALTIDVSTAGQVNKLFCNSFLATQSSEVNESQCNIGFYFDSISGLNRQRWNDQLEAAAKLAQSLGGSSNFRFQPNNSLSAAGGSYDSAGDADPGAGGGSGS
jgi:hypothetical protein